MNTNAKVNIPLLELKLSDDTTFVMYSYLTVGESRELQRVLIGTGKFNVETGKMEDVSTETFFIMQDKAAVFLIKSVKNKDGVEEPFTMEMLNSLPVEEGNKVYEKLNELTQASTLAPEVKKK